jgi:pyruvate formate lyase activating enzyme
VDYEFRTTLVPSLIGEEEVYELARKIRGARRYTLQNFNPRDPLDSGLRKVAPWDDETLRRMQTRVNEILRS